MFIFFFFFFSSRRRHTRWNCDGVQTCALPISESDRVFLRRYSGGRWGDRLTVTEKPADIFMTAVAAVHGKATVVWSEREGQSWQLKARTQDPSGLGKTTVITSAEGSHLFHRLTADR